MSSSRGLNTYGLVETGDFRLRLRWGWGIPNESILRDLIRGRYGLSQKDGRATSLNQHRRKLHEYLAIVWMSLLIYLYPEDR